MFISSIKKAFTDTLKGQKIGFLSLVVGAILGFLYLHLIEGKKVALEEVPYILAGIFGAIGALILLFLWNLICAPYRLERDARIDAENKLKEAIADPALVAELEEFKKKERCHSHYKEKYQEAFSFYKKACEWKGRKSSLTLLVERQNDIFQKIKQNIQSTDYIEFIKYKNDPTSSHAYDDLWSRRTARDIDCYLDECQDLERLHMNCFGENQNFSDPLKLRSDPLAYRSNELVQKLPEIKWQDELRKFLDIHASNGAKLSKFAEKVDECLSKCAKMAFLEAHEPAKNTPTTSEILPQAPQGAEMEKQH